MRVMVNGKQYQLDQQSVADALGDVEPGIGGKYFILANGRRYPVKQALARCLGVPPIRIQSAHALAILEKAGFEIIEGGSN